VEGQTASSPVRVSLSRVGLTGVEKVIRLGLDERSAQPFAARLECFVEPDPGARTADTPRFEAVVSDAVVDVVVGAAGIGMRAERLAREVAGRVRERQGARRVEVAIAARFPERRLAPVSGTPTQEISTLHARAMASARGTRWMVGVSAQGITTSPHAQGALAARAREGLAAGGFSAAEIERVLERVPVATDDQIGVGTLHLGCPEDCALEFEVAAMLAIVEGAMSSEIFELMKRSDEGAVVERAHFRARSVEDCVRAMVAGVVERFADLPDGAFLSAAQENTETIHAHRVVAECAGLIGELRRELRTGDPVVPRTSMRRWLEAGG
jgi:GTP cyclohydrolase-4